MHGGGLQEAEAMQGAVAKVLAEVAVHPLAEKNVLFALALMRAQTD